MGYYTHYELTWDPSQTVRKKCPTCLEDTLLTDEVFETMKKIFPMPIGDAEDIDAAFEEPLKWYSHENNMRELSKEFPGVVFTLKGEGEEAGDYWIKYFRNGMMQHEALDLKLPEFDEEKLK